MMRLITAAFAAALFSVSAFASPGFVHNPHPYLDLAFFHHGGAPVAGGGGGGTTPVTYAWRGDGLNTRLAIQKSNGNGWSTCSRTPHTSANAFQHIKVGWPTFFTTAIPAGQPNAGNIADQAFTVSYTYQAEIEYPYTQSLTNVPINTRSRLKFSGANVYTYTAGTTPAGIALTDDFNVGQVIPAGITYGILFCAETLDQTAHNATEGLPQSQNTGTYDIPNGAYETSFETNTSQVAAGFLDTQTTFRSWTAGAPYVFLPAVIDTYIDASKKTYALMGDSKEYGINDASTSGGIDGNLRSGWWEKYINGLGYGLTNISKGSDGWKWISNPTYVQYRLPLLQLINPTDIGINHAFNDSGYTLAQIKSNAATAIGLIKNVLPSVHFVLATLEPASGTPSAPPTYWSQTSDQTPNAAFVNPTGVLYQWNNQVIRGLDYADLGTTFSYIEASDTVSTSRDSGIWLAPYTPSASLVNPMGVSDTTLTLSAPLAQCNNSRPTPLLVDNEQVFVTAGQATTTPTITRAFSGTTAASHAAGATVYNIRQLSWDGTHESACGSDYIASHITSADPS